MSDLCFIHTTVDDKPRAEGLARELVEEKLAACVHVEPPVNSVYRWEGQVEQTEEIRLLIKTRTSLSEEVFDWLLRHHPYDCPEILRTAVQVSHDDYEEWVHRNTC